MAMEKIQSHLKMERGKGRENLELFERNKEKAEIRDIYGRSRGITLNHCKSRI